MKQNIFGLLDWPRSDIVFKWMDYQNNLQRKQLEKLLGEYIYRMNSYANNKQDNIRTLGLTIRSREMEWWTLIPENNSSTSYVECVHALH